MHSVDEFDAPDNVGNEPNPTDVVIGEESGGRDAWKQFVV